MRYLSVLLVLALCGAPVYLVAEEAATPTEEVVAEAPAEEVADEAAPVEESKEAAPAEEGGTPAWIGILLAALGVVVTWLANMLRGKLKIDGQKAAIDADKSLMEQRNFLIDNRLIPFAISTGEHWLISQLPALIKDATDGNGFQWKDHFDNLKAYLKDEVVKKFAAENVDLIERLGERELNSLINRLAVKMVSKLPDSVEAFLPDSVVEMLTAKASEFVVEKGKDLLGVE